MLKDDRPSEAFVNLSTSLRENNLIMDSLRHGEDMYVCHISMTRNLELLILYEALLLGQGKAGFCAGSTLL